MKMTHKRIQTNESGQALIFVIATMTVALAVGVGVSLRNLSSISRTSRSDTAARAQAAAEGGAENILSKSESELETLASSGATTTIQFTPTTNDNITAVAEVTVENYNIPDGQAFLPITIQKDQMTEVKLNGGAMTVCWSSLDEEAGSDLYFVSYNESGTVNRDGALYSDRSGFPSGYNSNFSNASGGRDSFENCHAVSLPSSAAGMRIRSINADSTVGVYPTSGSLPDQGYKITSIGKLSNVAQGEDAEAVVTVIRSLPYMPGVFDFGIFSGSTGEALD